MEYKPLVIDASVTIAWLLDDEGGDALSVIDALPSHSIIVPSIWIYEVSNALMIAEQRRRSTSAQTAYWAEIIDGLEYTVDTSINEISCRDIVALARSNNLLPYDASYLDLAMRRNAPLATLDRRLRKAAKMAGIVTI